MDCIKMHLEVTIKEGGLVKKEAVQVVKKGVITTIANATDMGTPAATAKNMFIIV
jgi:hypothetical protein